jgi:ubiquinone/menaquinone biosynthesis C-methylase UbiE
VALLHHLAGSIVVKENRNRYQKEQFDRLVASVQYNALNSRNLSLREFCRQYANMIEVLIEDSHNDRSPKIEANYDDYAEKTVRPINATIFYYFFSADHRRRTIAQWLLSAARYPNERVRRAYMHFFA